MTDQPQFTPGPWETDNNDGYSINRVFAKVRGHDAIAVVIGDSAETEANARLIAAAPDMFEALEDAIWALANCASALTAAGLEGTIADPLPKMGAALAKAQGQA